MIRYPTRRRNTRPPTFRMLAVVCTIGAVAWYALYRLAMVLARWGGWL